MAQGNQGRCPQTSGPAGPCLTPWLRRIKTWLKAGMLEEDGTGRPPAAGPLPGGVVSPSLAPVDVQEALELQWETGGTQDRKGAVSRCR